MALNGLASAGIDMGMQYMAAASQGKDPWKEMRWGSVGASFVSGAATTGVMGGIAKAGGALAANTFNAMFQRAAIANTIDFGVRSLGLIYDSKVHHLDYGKELGRQAISSAVAFGSNVGQGFANNLSGKGWDPAFMDFKDRINEYRPDGWLTRFDPGSINKGVGISNPKDYIYTYTQINIITFTATEYIMPSQDDQGSSDQQWDGTFTLPNPEVPNH